ncbi:hypothetical protein KQ940_09355 [Marinobacterium sp. D7]|nr:hypothetical protein [Marinobacterium ramblicola]
MELRLHKCRKLLLKTKCSTSKIATICGFISHTHFIHSLKKCTARHNERRTRRERYF